MTPPKLKLAPRRVIPPHPRDQRLIDEAKKEFEAWLKADHSAPKGRPKGGKSRKDEDLFEGIL